VQLVESHKRYGEKHGNVDENQHCCGYGVHDNQNDPCSTPLAEKRAKRHVERMDDQRNAAWWCGVVRYPTDHDGTQHIGTTPHRMLL